MQITSRGVLRASLLGVALALAGNAIAADSVHTTAAASTAIVGMTRSAAGIVLRTAQGGADGSGVIQSFSYSGATYGLGQHQGGLLDYSATGARRDRHHPFVHRVRSSRHHRLLSHAWSSDQATPHEVDKVA